jgi:two-component system OmpR family response regulator
MPSDPPRILLVDDDDDLREMLHTWLTKDGLSVVAVGDSAAGATLLERGEVFDLVIADVRLPPPMDGVAMVHRMRAHVPTLKALFISGRSAPVVLDQERDDFVSKPFWSNGEFLGCVRELLLRKPERSE